MKFVIIRLYNLNKENMRFKTKWDLLEHLWKDRTYVRYVDKLMSKDIVYMVDWEYEYNDPYDEELKKYEDEIEELRKENERLKKELAEISQQVQSTSSSSSELEEYKANCEYWHNQFRKMKRGYELVIEMTYKEIIKHTKIEKSEYIEQLWDAVMEIIDNEFWHED